jgi:hypothetical protein
MRGTNKSRGYCLEIVGADFLAGANLDTRNPDGPMLSLDRLFGFLPHHKQWEFLEAARGIL